VIKKFLKGARSRAHVFVSAVIVNEQCPTDYHLAAGENHTVIVSFKFIILPRLDEPVGGRRNCFRISIASSIFFLMNHASVF
jgi:hypothetical protein